MPIPAPDTRLFEAADLSNWLGKTVSEDRASMVESVVWGWLKTPLGLDTRPADVPEEVFSWAIELGAIAHENPSGLSARQLGDDSKQFSAERRDQILADAATDGLQGAVPAPRGSFPAASCYPDPAW